MLANHRRGERRRIQLADRLRANLAGRQPIDVSSGELAQLAAAFRSLPDSDREVLALEGWEELDPGEIAVVLGCSRNAARIRLHRARRRLRAAIVSSRDPRSGDEPVGKEPEGAPRHRPTRAGDASVTKGEMS